MCELNLFWCQESSYVTGKIACPDCSVIARAFRIPISRFSSFFCETPLLFGFPLCLLIHESLSISRGSFYPLPFCLSLSLLMVKSLSRMCVVKFCRFYFREHLVPGTRTKRRSSQEILKLPWGVDSSRFRHKHLFGFRSLFTKCRHWIGWSKKEVLFIFS